MILVTGANGMVGSYVEEFFKDDKLVLTDLPEMDVSNKDKVFSLVSKYRPAFVLHLAAETNVDKCETEIDHAFMTNTIGTHNVALACQEYNAIMIYISTGGVFNGTAKQIHNEFDTPDPANIYSKSKYEGERVVNNMLHKYYIFRAGWMIGGGAKKDKKFVGKIIELCKTHKTIDAVDDKYGSPTFARDLLSGIKAVIKTDNYGLYHMVNTGICTRYDIATEIAQLVNPSVTVRPVSSDKFPLPAPRAASEAMRNYKLDLMGLNCMPAWKEALAKYIKEWD
jgi:dTDP-4-dehydrorhamnose reductase